MREQKSIRHFLLLVALALFVPVLVYAVGAGYSEEIQQLQTKIEQKKGTVAALEKSIEAYKKRISQTQLEAVSLQNQVSILDNRKAQVELDIKLTQNRLDTIDLEIQSLDLEIDSKKNSIERQQEIVAEMLRGIHYNDRKKYIEVAAAYDDFSGFYNQVQQLQTVEQDLGKSARGLQIAKDELGQKRDQSSDRREAYARVKEELDAKQEELGEQQFLKENLLTETRSSERTYQTLLGSLRGQYQQIENEISGIEQDIRKRLEQQNQLQDRGDSNSGELSWPTSGRYITARFRDPDYPYRNIFEHNAIDIRAEHGTPVRAAASGYVARAKRCTSASCYSYVMIIHSAGISTLYGHTSKIVVDQDQFVSRGDIIAYSGGTPGTVGAGPFVTGPHLHFEVRKGGIPVNPLNYLVKDY